MAYVALKASRDALLDTAKMAAKVCSQSKLSRAAIWTESHPDRGWRTLVVEADARRGSQSVTRRPIREAEDGRDWPRQEIKAAALLKMVENLRDFAEIELGFEKPRKGDANHVTMRAGRARYVVSAFEPDWTLDWPNRVSAYHTIYAADLLKLIRTTAFAADAPIDQGGGEYQLDVVAIDLADPEGSRASAVGTDGGKLAAATRPSQSHGGHRPAHPLLLSGKDLAVLDLLCDRGGEAELWIDREILVATVAGHTVRLPLMHGRYVAWRRVVEHFDGRGTRFQAFAGELLRAFKLGSVCCDLEEHVGVDVTLLQNTLVVESEPGPYGASTHSVSVGTHDWRGSVEARLDFRPVRTFLGLLNRDEVVEGRLHRDGIHLVQGDQRFLLASLADADRRDPQHAAAADEVVVG